jgi:hypothetical protein
MQFHVSLQDLLSIRCPFANCQLSVIIVLDCCFVLRVSTLLLHQKCGRTGSNTGYEGKNYGDSRKDAMDAPTGTMSALTLTTARHSARTAGF